MSRVFFGVDRATLGSCALFRTVARVALRRRTQVVTVRGRKLLIPRNLSWAFTDSGEYYERNVVYWFEELLKLRPRPIVYDIGANCGYYSLLAADVAAAIYAFEPVQDTYRLLIRNVRQNRLENVHPRRLALGQARGEASMVLYNACGNDSMIARNPLDAAVESLVVVGSERVSVASLDELYERSEIPPPDVVKVDVEGSELRILRGARRLLSSTRPALIMEHNERYARDFGYSLSDVCDELARHSYSLFGLSDAERGDPDDIRLDRLSEVLAADIGTVVAMPTHGNTGVPGGTPNARTGRRDSPARPF